MGHRWSAWPYVPPVADALVARGQAKIVDQLRHRVPADSRRWGPGIATSMGTALLYLVFSLQRD